MVRSAPRTAPPYPEIDALADRGGHRTFCHNASDNPRRYQGRCFDCGWSGNETTGNGALTEMLDHTKSTVPRR
jgi:hypothetical protein